MNTDIKKDITKISRGKVKMENMLEEIESSIYLVMRSFHSINILEDTDTDTDVDTDVDTKNYILRGKNENNKMKKKNATKKKEKEINFTKKIRRKKRQKIVWNYWIIDTSSESSGYDFS